MQGEEALILELPWPPSILNPNNRSHWARKAKVKARVREDAYYKTQMQDTPDFGDKNIHLHIEFFPPSKRRYDVDNALAALKSSLDGIADAWEVNDRRFKPITIEMSDLVIKGGLVKISIINRS